MGKITFLKRFSLVLGLFLSTATAVVAFQNPGPKITTYVVTEVTCPGTATGAIDITAEGTGSLTFSWEGPFGFTSNEEDIYGLEAGEYKLKITDSANPSNPLNEVFEVTKLHLFSPPEPIEVPVEGCSWEPEAPLSPPEITDQCGQVEITGTVNGQPIPQEFPLGETIITWTAIGENDISQTETQTITVLGGPRPNEEELGPISTSCAISLTPPTAVDCEGNLVTGETENKTFTPHQNNTQTHIITWTFTDRHGNKSTATQKLTLEPQLFADVSPSPVKCFGGSNGSISITASGGKAPYSYAVNDEDFQDSETIQGLAAGFYTIKVKDVYGCIFVKKNVEITQPEPLHFEAEYSTTPESCFGAKDGKIEMTPSITGGTGPYKYYVNNVFHSDEPVLEGLGAGDYLVSVRDINGCTTTTTLNITVDGPDQLEANYAKTDVTCFAGNDGEIRITNPSGGNDNSYFFRINQGNWMAAPTGEGYTFEGLTAGTYTIEMTDESQTCERILVEDFVISQPEELQASVITTRTTSYGSATGTATAEMIGGNGTPTYSWKNSEGEEIGISQTKAGLAAGNYSVTITDGKGCSTTVEDILVYDALDAEIIDETTCEESNSLRTSTFRTHEGLIRGKIGELDYQWDFGNNVEVLDGNSDLTGTGPFKVQFGSPGDKEITLTVTDNADGQTEVFTFPHYVARCFEVCDKSSSNFIADPSSFFIGNSNREKIISDCDDEEEMYLYFKILKNSNAKSLFVSYTYTVQNETSIRSETISHCFTNEDGQLEEGKFIRINKVGSGEDEINWNCDEILSIIHINYSWSNEISDCSDFQDENALEEEVAEKKKNDKDNGNNGNGNENGNNGNNGNGNENGGGQNNWCSGSNDFMAVSTPIWAKATPSPTCYAEKEGAIEIEALGGTGNFEYIVEKIEGEDTLVVENTNHVTSVYLGLSAGIYTVTVNSEEKKLDSQGLETNVPRITYTISNVEVTSPKGPLEAALEITHVTCFGAEDGKVKITTVRGGTPPYTYSWNVASETPETLEDLDGGTYTLTITDSLGCTLTETAVVKEPIEVTQADAGNKIITCGFTSTTLNANPAGENEEGQWQVKQEDEGEANEEDQWAVSGDGWEFSDINSPNSEFTGTAGETYSLKWNIRNKDDAGCPTSSTIEIEIKEKCQNLIFDGIDDYIDMGDQEHFNLESTEYSLEAWIKLETPQSTGTIFSKKDAHSTTGGYELFMQPGGVPAFKIKNTTIVPDDSDALTNRRWYHLAITFDNSVAKLYVDGIEVKEASIDHPTPTSAPFLIGATYSSSGDSYTKPDSHFQGWIEEARIWKTALTPEQIRFMMNQRLEKSKKKVTPEEELAEINIVKGSVIPLPVPGDLEWRNLAGYYQLLSEEARIGNGTTKDRSLYNIPGDLKNMDDLQENSAPLPYISEKGEDLMGNWDDIMPNTSPWKYNRGKWDAPNSNGINNKPIDWNIVKIRAGSKITSKYRSLTLLGLILDKEIEMEKTTRSTLVITNANYPANELNPGYGLTVTKYLDLNGVLDLEGNSQLIQGEGSILAENSTGHLEIDQQGTASSYNYNYWSSPVAPDPNGTTYTVGQVMFDGTTSGTNKAKEIQFGRAHTFADSPARQDPITISEYWINAFYPEADEQNAGQYSAWRPKGSSQDLKLGQGYTMKGSYSIEMAEIEELQEYQNYTFKGFPNNGDINLRIGSDQNYLVGNPYPSAIDADKFIEDNLEKVRGKNIFNGSLYFWSHFSGDTHYLSGYVGGYATYNLSGGVRAVANDARINATRERGGEIPQRYIAVGQAFFVNTTLDAAIKNWNSSNSRPVEIKGGEIKFRNSQRVFERKDPDRSVFHRPESKEDKIKSEKEQDQRKRIWLNFESPMGYDRQLLVTEDRKSTFGFDLGYDAPLIDDTKEDMYWEMQDIGFVIQGVPAFSKDQELPLGLKLGEGEKDFTIGIDQLTNVPEDFEIHLKDSLREETHDLRKAPYKASAEAGTIHGRFSLVFLNEKEREQTEDETSEKPEEELEEDNNFSLELAYSKLDQQVIITNPDSIPIEKASLYNLNGQKLQEFHEIPLEKIARLAISSQTSGVYIIKVEAPNGSRSLKFIIN